MLTVSLNFTEAKTSTQEHLVTPNFPATYFLKVKKYIYTEDVTDRPRDVLKIIFSSSKIKAQTKKKSKENCINVIYT